MIFVLIGIIILVVSFVIALVTLSREQVQEKHLIESIRDNELGDEVAGEVFSKQEQKVTKKEEIISSGISDNSEGDLAEPNERDELSNKVHKTSDREPFPWEQDFKVGEEDKKEEVTIEPSDDDDFSLQITETPDEDRELGGVISLSDDLKKDKS